MTPSQINDLIALVLGSVLPVLISYLKNSQWSQKQRLLCALVICALVGVLQVLVQLYATHTPITLQTMLTNSGLIFSAATVTYKFWFRDTTLNTSLEKQVTL